LQFQPIGASIRLGRRRRGLNVGKSGNDSMIKQAAAACALALASIATPIAASAAQMSANPYLVPARTVVIHVYSCVARSPTGSYGYSTNIGTLAGARLIALRQCAIRTPRGLVCVITRCV
jgi:hypothetical protein